MSISDLVKEARSDILGDTVPEYLWSDKQLTRYALEAVKEACIRSPLMVKAYALAITAATAEYAISSYIRQLLYVMPALQSKPLQQDTDVGLTMRFGYNWREHTGTPSHYVRTGSKIRLFPIPIVNDSLVISASAIPDDDFDLDADIDPVHHKGLLNYIAYKAYLLNDADTYSANKAAEFLRLFNEEYGVKHSAAYDMVSHNTPMYGTMTHAGMC